MLPRMVLTAGQNSINQHTIGCAKVSHLSVGLAELSLRRKARQNKCNVQIGSYYTDAACLITTFVALDRQGVYSLVHHHHLDHHLLLLLPSSCPLLLRHVQIICADDDEQLFRNSVIIRCKPRCHNWPTRALIIGHMSRGVIASHRSRRTTTRTAACDNSTEIALQSHAEHMIAMKTDIINK